MECGDFGGWISANSPQQGCGVFSESFRKLLISDWWLEIGWLEIGDWWLVVFWLMMFFFLISRFVICLFLLQVLRVSIHCSSPLNTCIRALQPLSRVWVPGWVSGSLLRHDFIGQWAKRMANKILYLIWSLTTTAGRGQWSSDSRKMWSVETLDVGSLQTPHSRYAECFRRDFENSLSLIGDWWLADWRFGCILIEDVFFSDFKEICDLFVSSSGVEG